MSLSTDPSLAVHQPSVDARVMMQYDALKKSGAVAFLLWFFFGMVGAHRFYLTRGSSAVAMLVIFVISLVLLTVAIGMLGLIILGVWVIIDAFKIPHWLREYNSKLAAGLRA